jgi:disulfide bond formation protein DsbB
METSDKASTSALDNPDMRAASGWAWAALAVAVATAAGSLALSLMEQKQPCPLCFYQRTFALCLVAILARGLLTGVSPAPPGPARFTISDRRAWCSSVSRQS